MEFVGRFMFGNPSRGVCNCLLHLGQKGQCALLLFETSTGFIYNVYDLLFHLHYHIKYSVSVSNVIVKNISLNYKITKYVISYPNLFCPIKTTNN